MLLSLFILIVSGAEWWENSVTFDITDSNYNQVIGSSQHVVIEFFAPFCHWCQRMFHEYEALSTHYNGDQSAWKRPDILIARVNAQFNPLLGQKYNIYQYPTIVLIPAGQDSIKSMFNDNRIKSIFIRWIEQTLNLESQPILEPDKNERASESILHETIEMIGGDHKGHDKKDLNEELMQFEMVIEDVESHSAEKWQGEFKALNILLEEMKENQQGDFAAVMKELGEVSAAVRQQVLQVLIQVEETQKKLGEVDEKVTNRNKIENTQSRFNLTHMIVFLSLGCIVGFALSLYFVKVKDIKHLNKV